MVQYLQGRFGIDQGEVMPFSHFEDDGPMWAGTGTREVRSPISFSVPFSMPPLVQLGVTMWDIAETAAMRLDVASEAVDAEGFTLRLRTWGDSRIARLRVSWIAFGACRDDEMWEID